ncbi:hypothetical protein [Psychroserpens luteus]|uniref:Uncharacterized protein n=1 Tax=Psychroserpens luteus TaxID=1434066 RepID=A0ABW5ZRF3_9FLAO|nr:hypothetical protein [Psychroserpens luteus]
MNSSANIYSRLLDAFPKKVLDQNFGVTGTKDSIINSVAINMNAATINSFINQNFGYLHKHIYFFETSIRVKSITITNPLVETLDTTVNRHGITATFLYKNEVSYYNTQTNSTEVLIFKVPFRLITKGPIVQLLINTHARDLRTYFNFDIFKASNNPIDKEIKQIIQSTISSTLIKLDLNKGIKELWKIDYFDAKTFRNKDATAANETKMDEQYLFKLTYPVKWGDAMLTPLRNNRFKTLNSTADLKHFDCDPTEGIVSMKLHPETVDAHENFINLLLSNN